MEYIENTIYKGQDIGRNSGHKYIYHACLGCGKLRLVQIKHGNPSNSRCYKCARAISRTNNLGKRARLKFTNSNGYTMLRITSDSSFFVMVSRNGFIPNVSGYVMEHRLLIAQQIGRPLIKQEVVHHLNGERSDNRLSNLLLLTGGKHNRLIPAMQKRIQKLEGQLRKQGQLV